MPELRRVITSKKGVVTFQYVVNGIWRSLTSAYDPVREAKQQIRGVDLEYAKIIFVLGEGGLYHLDVLLDEAPADVKILLVSVDPSNLRLVLEHRNLSRVLSDDRLIVVTSTSVDYLKAALRSVIGADLYDIPTFSLVIHPVENLIQAEFVDQFQHTLHWYYTVSLTAVNTTQVFEHWWSHNFVANIPFLLTSNKVGHLENSWRGRPAIIVGAGPSLNKNIHLLKEVKDNALVLCVDTAYRILVKAGVKPDLLITLDGSPMNVKHLEGCDYSEVPLFLDEYSHRDVTTSHHGPKIVNTNGMFHEHWWNRVYGGTWEPSSIPTGGSVATTGFSLARLMGADPVIMMGVDLSYPEGQLYANGALHGGKTTTSQSHRQFIEITDIQGKPVHTTFDYLVYLRWLEQEAQKSDRLYINATEGGALKNGFKIMEMTEVVREYCRKTQPVSEWQARFMESAEQHDVRVVLRNLKRSRREIKAAATYLGELKRTAEEYHSRQADGAIDKLSDLSTRMEGIQKHLTKLQFAMDFLDAHSFQAIYNDIKLTALTDKVAEELTQREKLEQKSAQMCALIAQLWDIAHASIEMHDDGIRQLTEMLLDGGDRVECDQYIQKC